MKNKKKGFTLIELLAIIVILAIIAVITVPIILNIIDNSRKGAAQDSAYGYKDAINKYYVGKLSENSNYNIPNGTYTVDAQTGYLVGTETLEIQVEGQKPNSGAVKLEKNNIKQACLKFGDYAVTITDGSVGTAQKASCNGTILGSSNGQDGSGQGSNASSNSLSMYTDSSEETPITSVDDLQVGSYITIGDEGFYVINPNKDGNVILLAEYNLKEQPATIGYNAPSNGMMLMSNRVYVAEDEPVQSITWKQGTEDDYTPSNFSDTNYWYGNKEKEICEESATPGWEPNCWTESEKDFLEDFPEDDHGYRYIYTRDNKNNLYSKIENYKNYLINNLNVNIIDARLASYEDITEVDGCTENGVSCPLWGTKAAVFWLGSTVIEANDNVYNNNVYPYLIASYTHKRFGSRNVFTYADYLESKEGEGYHGPLNAYTGKDGNGVYHNCQQYDGIGEECYDYNYGIRPVIEISRTEFAS